ncbi:Uncharacterised protein [uncultured archaeon]|nr:Uncharacterised protein [uncultured archaeon]
MTIAILPCRFPFGRTLLLGCILLGLMISLSAAASDDQITNITAPMKGYAVLNFSLPSQVVVEPETIDEADYAAGREVKASMRLNDSRVSIHIIYPCQIPQRELKPAELIPLLKEYNSALVDAKYNDTMQSQALWGQVENQILFAYQPVNQAVVLVLMDGNMNEKIMTSFLENLSIGINEGTTPLTPGYCPDTTVAAATTTNQTPAVTNPAASLAAEKTTPAETRADSLSSAKEKMAADMEAAKEKLAAAKERMKGF